MFGFSCPTLLIWAVWPIPQAGFGVAGSPAIDFQYSTVLYICQVVAEITCEFQSANYPRLFFVCSPPERRNARSVPAPVPTRHFAPRGVCAALGGRTGGYFASVGSAHRAVAQLAGWLSAARVAWLSGAAAWKIRTGEACVCRPPALARPSRHGFPDAAPDVVAEESLSVARLRVSDRLCLPAKYITGVSSLGRSRGFDNPRWLR